VGDESTWVRPEADAQRRWRVTYATLKPGCAENRTHSNAQGFSKGTSPSRLRSRRKICCLDEGACQSINFSAVHSQSRPPKSRRRSPASPIALAPARRYALFRHYHCLVLFRTLCVLHKRARTKRASGCGQRSIDARRRRAKGSAKTTPTKPRRRTKAPNHRVLTSQTLQVLVQHLGRYC
jgi:hypothetical protein